MKTLILFLLSSVTLLAQDTDTLKFPPAVKVSIEEIDKELQALEPYRIQYEQTLKRKNDIIKTSLDWNKIPYGSVKNYLPGIGLTFTKPEETKNKK